MKRTYKVNTGRETIEREYNYIPVRYIVAAIITLLEMLSIIQDYQPCGGACVNADVGIHDADCVWQRNDGCRHAKDHAWRNGWSHFDMYYHNGDPYDRARLKAAKGA